MGPTIYIKTFNTDLVGKIGVAVNQSGLLRLRMFQDSQDAFLALNNQYQEGKYIVSDLETQMFVDQIRAYLNKEIKEFDLPIDWTVYTDFQRAVLQETYQIPYGQTRSYGEIAASIGNPKAVRAVGQAEKSNQVPLVVPCHRVIGADGSLTGYGGKENIELKAALLAFEGVGI